MCSCASRQVVVEFCGQRRQTHIFRDSLDPEFNCAFSFSLPTSDQSHKPYALFAVLHRDQEENLRGLALGCETIQVDKGTVLIRKGEKVRMHVVINSERSNRLHWDVPS